MVRPLGLVFVFLATLLVACEDAPLPHGESAPILQTRWHVGREALKVRTRPDGLQEIDLAGRVQHRALAVVSADGGVRRACSTSPDLSQVGVPPAREAEPEPVEVQ